MITSIDDVSFGDVTKGEEYIGTSYYLDLCQEKEQAYTNIRKNLPIFFENVRSFIENIEKPNICEYFFTGNNS